MIRSEKALEINELNKDRDKLVSLCQTESLYQVYVK